MPGPGIASPIALPAFSRNAVILLVRHGRRDCIDYRDGSLELILPGWRLANRRDFWPVGLCWLRTKDFVEGTVKSGAQPELPEKSNSVSDQDVFR